MRWAIEFPLVQRQMLQTAQKNSVWFIRGLLVILQIIVGLIQYANLKPGIAALGSGSNFIIGSTNCNLLMIYLLMPLTACSAISGERSRQTLPLLLISRISPSRLLWEKFLWSLQPVFTMIIASLPVLAIGYTLGGMPAERVALCALAMFIAAVQVNSAAIFWSSLTDKSVSAFWGTIFLLFMVICFPAILSASLEMRATHLLLWGIEIDFSMIFSRFWLMTGESVILSSELAILVAPPLLLSFVLLFTSGLLVSRYRWESPIVHWRRSLKEFFGNLRLRPRRTVTRHTSLSVPPRKTGWQLPGSNPIAWRECRACITTRLETHIALSVIVLGLVYWLLRSGAMPSAIGSATFVQSLLLFLGILQVQSLASRSIGLERERETLQVLLTTPLSLKEILQQKFAAASRSRYLLMIPAAVLSLVSLTGTYLPYSNDMNLKRTLGNPFLSEVLLLLLIFQQLTLTQRLAEFCSVTLRTTMRAATATIVTLFAYWIGQLIFIGILTSSRSLALVPSLPIGGFVVTMTDEFRHPYIFPVFTVLVGMGFTEVLSFALWRLTIDGAAENLGRSDGAVAV